MKHSDSITSVQLAVIVIGTMLGIAILGLPRFIIEKAQIAAPLATLLGIAFAFIGFLALVYLGKRFPKHTFVGYNRMILGKVLGDFFNILFLTCAIILVGLETRQFAEVLIGGLLPSTPIQVSIFFMILLCAVINYSNVSTFAYIHFFYLPFIILPLIIVLLPSIKDAELYHLLPVYGHDVSIKNFFVGAFSVMGTVGNFFVIAFIFPYLKKPKSILKASVSGFLIGAVIILLLIIISLAVFGEVMATEMYWPTLILARMVEVPGEILARIDAIFIISWVFAVFTTLCSYYFVFVRGIAEMFKSTRYQRISLVTFPIAFIVAILPRSIYELYNLIFIIWTSAVAYYIVHLFILILIAKIRHKKESVA